MDVGITEKSRPGRERKRGRGALMPPTPTLTPFHNGLDACLCQGGIWVRIITLGLCLPCAHLLMGPDSVIQEWDVGRGRLPADSPSQAETGQGPRPPHTDGGAAAGLGGTLPWPLLDCLGGRRKVAVRTPDHAWYLTHSPPLHIFNLPKKQQTWCPLDTKETRAQKGVGTCPRPHSWHGRKKEKGEFQPRFRQC